MNTIGRFGALCAAIIAATCVEAQVIDMHLHSYSPQTYFGGRGAHPGGATSPETVTEHLQETIAEMDRNDIRYAVVSGSLDSVATFVAADARFIPGYYVPATRPGDLVSPEEFEERVKAGTIRVFGELAPIFGGKTLADPMFAPYLAICEQYGVPVAIHTGSGPPMVPYNCCPEFRIALGEPYLLEDVLVRYPRLKIYLMHAGESFYRQAIMMMMMYRQLHVGLGAMLWVSPLMQDYAEDFLQEAQTAGLLDRVMFGTDQMVWPGSITLAIDYLDSIEFLSEQEKRAILHDNAARFLGLEKPQTGD